MTVSKDYVDYVMDCISKVHLNIHFCCMFGGYCIYANDKPIMFVFNNTVYVKQYHTIENLMHGCRLVNLFENTMCYRSSMVQIL